MHDAQQYAWLLNNNNDDVFTRKIIMQYNNNEHIPGGSGKTCGPAAPVEQGEWDWKLNRKVHVTF